MITIPQFIDKCFKSVKEANPDYPDEKIYAICWSQYNRLKKKKKSKAEVFTEEDLEEIRYEILKEEFEEAYKEEG